MRIHTWNKLIGAAVANGWDYTWEVGDIPVTASWLAGSGATYVEVDQAIAVARADGKRIEKTYSNFRGATTWIFVSAKTLVLRFTGNSITYVVEADFVNDRLVQIGSRSGRNPEVRVYRHTNSYNSEHCPGTMVTRETVAMAQRYIEANNGDATVQRERAQIERSLKTAQEAKDRAEQTLAGYDAAVKEVVDKATVLVGAFQAQRLLDAGLLRTPIMSSRADLVTRVERAEADITMAEAALAQLNGDES